MKTNTSDNRSTRTMCDILSNMRDCLKTLNFSYLSGLIEEAQYRAERMENALEVASYGYGGINAMFDEREKLRDSIQELKTKRNELRKRYLELAQEIGDLKDKKANKERDDLLEIGE